MSVTIPVAERCELSNKLMIIVIMLLLKVLYFLHLKGEIF